ncbi:mucoepidermoid carcinoma translocated, putative [Ixodes scapularis]|uniref:Mucoepidermoid carcinoma translocated, putative n=1 Tax=Ixodes scapularis TaxID=6945 RepID=B7QGB7_IXOSC|nr:mucoepidermoid carcinoma translocated, putative [Ixodes scapularis]|eukprot:XP_002401400.1 mucoepidermoid carcinoma translocated, putative [Ixodes scapularis]
MANPRKFSEKIALHNQKQAEETAAFEKIMREVMGATRSSHGLDNAQGYGAQYDSAYISQAANGAYPKHQLSMPSLGSYRGGSLPNVNQMSGGQGHSIDLQGALHHLEDMRHGREMALPPAGPDRPHGTRERGRHATAPHKSRQAAFDKRSQFDSRLHQSGSRRRQQTPCGDCSSSDNAEYPLQDVNSFAMDIMHLKGYWDPKGGGGGDCFGNSMQDMGCDISQQHRPKSCEVPGIK